MINKFLLTLLIAIPTMSFAEITDEVIIKEGESGKWMAEKTTNHDMWQKPACVSYTKGDDELSYLEVVSYYDNDTQRFLEPFISIVSPFDVSFFEVQISTERRNENFQMFPAFVEGSEMVGAKTLFNDRETLTVALKKRNKVTAKYFDTEGVVKEVKFSLSGSSVAINAQFKACALKFTPFSPEGLTEETPLP